MNRLKKLFDKKQKNILNIYTTAGFPTLNDTEKVVRALSNAKVDIIELGIPYSDPLADGPTIQNSSQKSLKNGMNLNLLFYQVEEIRKTIDTPIVLMGYLNQMIQYGVERFLSKANQCGVDALIIPDLPLNIFKSSYQSLFNKYNIGISFLVTPETSDARIAQADLLSTSFLYVVSKSNITGSKSVIEDDQINYFKKLDKMNLKNPRLIGFGIHDNKSFQKACEYANGAIIGSAFIRCLDKHKDQLEKGIQDFVTKIRS